MSWTPTLSWRMTLPRGGTVAGSCRPRQLGAESSRGGFQTGMEGQALARPTATSRAPHGMLVCSSKRSWTRVSIQGNALRDPPPLLGARLPPAPGRAGAGGAGGAVWEPPPSSKAPAGALTSAVPPGTRRSVWLTVFPVETVLVLSLWPFPSPQPSLRRSGNRRAPLFPLWMLDLGTEARDPVRHPLGP